MLRCTGQRLYTLLAALVLLPPDGVEATTDAAPDMPLARPGPAIAHHQHLISPAFAPIVQHPSIDVKALLHIMDAAGARRAVVLSMAYSFTDERKRLDDPKSLVRRENDWTAGQNRRRAGPLGRLL